VLVEVAHRTADNRNARLLLDALDLPLQSVGDGDVVRVEARDVTTLRDVEPAVQRRRQTGLLGIAHHVQAGIADLGEQLRRRIGRSVVDDDQLEVGQRLSEHALHRLADEAGVVVDGHEHGDERHGR
jgi:hypothetical protein